MTASPILNPAYRPPLMFSTWRQCRGSPSARQPGLGESRAGASPAQRTLDAALETIRSIMAASAAGSCLQPCNPALLFIKKSVENDDARTSNVIQSDLLGVNVSQ